MSTITTEQLTVELPAGQLFVKKWIPASDGGQPPLILLHDSLGCVDLWRDFPHQLSIALSRVVIAYDRFGFGKSSERFSLLSKGFIEDEATIYFPLIKKQLGV